MMQKYQALIFYGIWIRTQKLMIPTPSFWQNMLQILRDVYFDGIFYIITWTNIAPTNMYSVCDENLQKNIW